MAVKYGLLIGALMVSSGAASSCMDIRGCRHERAPSFIERRVYYAGEVIFHEGTVGEKAYLILKGQVRVTVAAPAGEILLSKLGEGEIFGEMSIVDPRPHTASVFAVSDVELYVIDETQFLNLTTKTPMFALRVMRVLATRLRAMNARLLESRQMTG